MKIFNFAALASTALAVRWSSPGNIPVVQIESSMSAVGKCMFNCDRYVQRCAEFGLPINPGKQITTGFCSTTPVGAMAPESRFPWSFIESPKQGEEVPIDTSFSVRVTVANFALGNAVPSSNQYYLTPQTMTDDKGFVMGHSHIAVQFIGAIETSIGLTPPHVPIAKEAEFFTAFVEKRPQGINTISFRIPGLKRRGWYRVCNFLGTTSHGPIMTLDDRRRFRPNKFDDQKPTVAPWEGDCIRIRVVNEDEFGLGPPTPPRVQLQDGNSPLPKAGWR